MGVKNKVRDRVRPLMRRKRKGDISIQMLIWIALGLVVLVIMIGVIIGKVKWFNQNTPDTCGQPCTPAKQECGEGEVRLVTTDCSGDNVCCKKLFG
jgi:hypothetical protein